MRYEILKFLIVLFISVQLHFKEILSYFVCFDAFSITIICLNSCLYFFLLESNLLCCSAEQIHSLKENFEIASTLGLERCPSCLSNFRKNFCHFACSPKQSDFLRVTGLGISDEGDVVIEKISYYMSRQ